MNTTMMRVPLLVDQLLWRAGRLFSDVEIVSRLPSRKLHRYRYGDFASRARALAQALIRAGLRKGERVATLSWNHYAHLEAYFGVPIAGGVLHTLNLRLPAADIGWIAAHAGDRFLIVDDVLLPLYRQFANQVPFERVIVVPLTDEPIPEGMQSYEDFLRDIDDPARPLPEKDENDACGLCYTSGTTGRPKGVVYSHRSTMLHALAAALPDSVGLSFNDVVLPVVPMFHANAWGLPYAATMVGAKQVFPGPFLDAESLLDLYQHERVTVTGGVPTIWMSILQALEQAPDRWTLPSMRMIVGGSAVPEAMIRRFERFGHTVIQGWGMTETSPLAAVSRLRPQHQELDADGQFRLRAKAGLPVPFVDLRLIAEDGNEVPWDGEAMGEIQLRGPWITGAYHCADDASDKFAADGWLRTGDVATVDREGYIQITDRTKDLIKSGGEWISSVQLENEIMAHEAVAEAAVIACPHERWGERPLAVVVLKPGRQPEESVLRDFLSARLDKWMLPEAFAFVEAIPRTSTGKFDKRALRQQLACGQLSSVGQTKGGRPV
ncbi:fatty-acyl-CoA synthase [Fontimonas thermophila]|uniref:Fatty-acyl-CoA synthase n=1 Tax=Fontimonas thermophila TaxID=1076937 RepID=A0A1I2KIX3_9GAMM|nr:long-chain fatty acid--CoA ligase [Fontimonas thermophila]SFF66463.1 fatty-acyl-CoA synthase [Fontimonas thermophila]